MISNSATRRKPGRPRVFTDDEVLAATAHVLARLGHGGLTLAAVAAELGCTGPALSHRFGSKRGLLLAYLDWATEAARARFREARHAHASPLAALTARFRLPAERRPDEVADPAGHANLVFFSIAARTDPTLRPAAVGRRRLFEDETAALLEEAREAGELIACDTRRLSRTLLAALSGTALHWVGEPDGPLEDRLGEVVDEVVGPYRVRSA
jgi:AcrR family transcriptional regulator